MTISVDLANPTAPDAVRLIAALDAVMGALYAPESNHLLPADRLARDDVRFFVARRDGEAVGCAALRLDPDGYGEVKRMYVVDAVRGAGVGRLLLERLEAEAAGLGLTCLRLETGILSDGALALYRAAGFVERGPFGDYWDDPNCLYFEKPISRSRS